MSEDQTNLRLYGKNSDDLNIISAYLQDSIVRIKDIIFLKENKIFLMMVKRFMWEDVEKGVFRKPKRIMSVIKFSNIFEVSAKNINQQNRNKILELLTIKAPNSTDGLNKIKMIFSGESIITLISEDINVILDDQGIPWKAKSIPKHKI